MLLIDFRSVLVSTGYFLLYALSIIAIIAAYKFLKIFIFDQGEKDERDYKGEIAKPFRYIISAYHTFHFFWASIVFILSLVLLQAKWKNFFFQVKELISNLINPEKIFEINTELWIEYIALILECVLFTWLLFVILSNILIYLFKRNVWESEFFEKNFVSGTSVEKDQLIKLLQNKRYTLYSHSLYHEIDAGYKRREHLLSISYIKFGARTGNSMKCELFIASRKRETEDNKIVQFDSEYKYEGIATFGEEGKTVLILLKPKKKRNIVHNTPINKKEGIPFQREVSNENSQKTSQQDKASKYLKRDAQDNILHPIIISGKLELTDGINYNADSYLPFRTPMSTEEMDFIYNKIKKTFLIPLQITQFSQAHESTQTKIGLLSFINLMKLSQFGEEDLNYTATFRNLEINEKDNQFEETIKLYLMRSSKVLIKSLPIGKGGNNNPAKINTWFSTYFGKLINDDMQFELFYRKSVYTEAISSVRRFGITFLRNGIALLERTKTIDNKCFVEKYFGEINIRHTKFGGKYLYIKLIENKATLPGESSSEGLGKNLGLIQNYRELFLLLFWKEPKGPDDKAFDFTRGIILGDKDKEPILNHATQSDHDYINANICVLCRRTKDWQLKFEPEDIKQSITHSYSDLKKYENEERIKRIYDDFLKKVFDSSSKFKVPFKDKIEDIDDISLEIMYNENEMCNYKSYF